MSIADLASATASAKAGGGGNGSPENAINSLGEARALPSREWLIGDKSPEKYLDSAASLIRVGRYQAAATIYRNFLKREDFTDAELLNEGLSSRGLWRSEKSAWIDLAHKGLVVALVLAGDIGNALVAAERPRERTLSVYLEQRINRGRLLQISDLAIDDIKRIAAVYNLQIVFYFLASEYELFIWSVDSKGAINFARSRLPSNGYDFEATESASATRLAVAAQQAFRGGMAWRSEKDENAQRQRLKHLYKLLIQPVASYLPSDPERKTVFIPQGSMLLTPFNALINEDGQYLINQHTLSVSPSIRILRDVLEVSARNGKTDWATLRGDKALIIGNPTMPRVPRFDETQTSSVGPSGSMKLSSPMRSLPGTQAEAVTIAQLFAVEPIMGANATGKIVMDRMPRAKIIHLATHGLLEQSSILEFGFNSVSMSEDVMPGAVALTPEKSETDYQGEFDDGGLPWGFLTSETILRTKLQASVVALSACNTAEGRINDYDVYGLPTAFIAAGAESVIMTLWSIPDSPTARLMHRFYTELQNGSDKARALRGAMLAAQSAHPNPRDWAAFTLIGSPN